MSQKLQQVLVRQIEAAFEKTQYPGDDNLVNLYHNDVFCHECLGVKETFQGKNWKSITKDVLVRNHDSIFLFKPEAYRYYLPAFLNAALQLLTTEDNLPASTIFSLSPLDKEKDYFHARIRGFTVDQKKVIKEFLEFYEQRTTVSYDKALKKALRFWRENS